MSAIEITTFRLTKRCSLRRFIAINADVDAWLKRQPGFCSRQIAELEGGSIVDVLFWDSAAQGKDAASRIMEELHDSPVHAAIDQRTVVWRVASVRHETRISSQRRRTPHLPTRAARARDNGRPAP